MLSANQLNSKIWSFTASLTVDVDVSEVAEYDKLSQLCIDQQLLWPSVHFSGHLPHLLVFFSRQWKWERKRFALLCLYKMFKIAIQWLFKIAIQWLWAADWFYVPYPLQTLSGLTSGIRMAAAKVDRKLVLVPALFILLRAWGTVRFFVDVVDRPSHSLERPWLAYMQVSYAMINLFLYE